jgi:8-oxo-dGTP diphosphatase
LTPGRISIFYSVMSERQLFRVHASVVVLGEDSVLLVQEAKAVTRGRWNLPGGHVDHGETVPAGAARELREETHITAPLDGLIGVYTGDASVRSVFRIDACTQTPTAGDEILDVKWFAIDAVLQMPDAELVSPTMLRQILTEAKAGAKYPLTMFCPTVFAPPRPN